MTKRVLVTGGSGFVGANLARRLLADGHEVNLLLRPQRDLWRLEGVLGNLRVHESDLGDAASVAGVVAAARPEWIFHLAAHGAYPTQTEALPILQTNLVGTVNLLEAAAAKGFEAFVNSGSSSEYGAKDHAPAEDEWLEPNSTYAVAKAAATLFCRQRARRAGLPVTTLRLYSVYGPFEEPSRLVPRLIEEGLLGRLPPLVNPTVARDFVHVEDVCDAYLRAADAGREPGAVYNVGTGIQTTLAEMVDLARRMLGIGAEPVWDTMPGRSWDTDVWVADPTRIKAELGWSPNLTLEEGLARTIAWYQAGGR
ncbi:MAG: NAD-dependent epimerase/dehydratase family protein [Candidatus Dormibacteraeota bacterium]|nr:NAD-dependent epimerase/dehydratase family protein [Candidatus Dormibacteraeota bacterium]